MKTIEFDASRLGDLQQFGKELFEDSSDPRSITYERKLERPKIDYMGAFLCLSFFATVFSVVNLVSMLSGLSEAVSLLSAFAALALCLALSMKKIIIFIVKLYQRYAPDSLRNKCRFEPSCSQYMILAIEKYGVIKGVNRGVKRLGRCNRNGGGYDYP